jgi:putative thioredoxin
MGEEVLASGDAGAGGGHLAQIVEMAPHDAAAQGGLVRALSAAGEFEAADAALAALPPELASDVEVQRARAALELARNKPEDSELAELREAAATGDMAARLAYAEAAFAAGERDTAADVLLAMIAEDRAWKDGAARAKLLQMFEAVGLEDPWVAAMRRRLSLILFG